jgi:transcriptional regulator with XRE-family HTH domain
MTKQEAYLRKVLGKNIQALRQKKQLSQESLGDLCGLHRTFVGSVERAERNVSLSTLVSLAIGLESTVPKLLSSHEDTQ